MFIYDEEGSPQLYLTTDDDEYSELTEKERRFFNCLYEYANSGDSNKVIKHKLHERFGLTDRDAVRTVISMVRELERRIFLGRVFTVIISEEGHLVFKDGVDIPEEQDEQTDTTNLLNMVAI